MASECPFETSLKELSQCINDLTNQTQYIKSLCNICLHDYNKKKFQHSVANGGPAETPSIYANIERDIEMAKIKAKNNEKRFNLRPKSYKKQRLQNEKYTHEDEQNADSEFQQLLDETHSNVFSEMGGIEIGKKEIIYNKNLQGVKRKTPDEMSLSKNEVDINNMKSINNMNNVDNINNIDNTNNINNINMQTELAKKAILTGRMSTKHTKKHLKAFSKLGKAEQKRIHLDSIEYGNTQVERKWGINRSCMREITKKEIYYTTEAERIEWMRLQKEVFNRKMENMNINAVIENIENSLLKIKNSFYQKSNTPLPPLTLEELSDLAFERGIAIAAVRYNIDIFELEYLLMTLHQAQWNRMEENKWYFVPPMFTNSEEGTNMSKLEIIKLAQKEGADYASKMSGVSEYCVYHYKLIYEEYGEEGLEWRENQTAKGKTKIHGMGVEKLKEIADGVKLDELKSINNSCVV